MVAVALVRPAALALSCALFAASVAPAQSPPSSCALEKGYVEDNLKVYISRARRAALEKLRSVKCRQLFTEFQDLSGHPLDDVLFARGETSEQHLWRMNFRDGSKDPICRLKGVFAFTSPGSLTIFICPGFRKLMAQGHVEDAAYILIHETLHSLGAGEAPVPGLLTAYEITDRVEDRCRW